MRGSEREREREFSIQQYLEISGRLPLHDIRQIQRGRHKLELEQTWTNERRESDGIGENTSGNVGLRDEGEESL